MTDQPHTRATKAWRAPVEARPVHTVGKYELHELVGAGAMGRVFRARDPDLDRDVAIKLMSVSVATDDRLRGRFHREARSAGSLQHPNIVTIYGAGETDGQLYIAMEYVEGRDLSDIIRNEVELPFPKKLEIIRDVLAGLAYAHRNGVIHRDIKPGNVRLTKDGRAKIVDFGVAHLAESDLTHSGSVLGTPNYIAPELLMGREPTPACDVFSVGGMFYELLSGVKPFDGETTHAVLYSVISDEPVPLDDVDAAVPPGIKRIIAKAISKDPELRYRSADEMLHDLDAVRAALESGNDLTVALASPRGRRVPSVRRTHAVIGAVAVMLGATITWAVDAPPADPPRPVEVDSVPAAVDSAVQPAPAAAAQIGTGDQTPASAVDTVLVSVRETVLAHRAEAAEAGVPDELLAAGDEHSRRADSLAGERQLSRAIQALSLAGLAWDEAEVAYRRPKPSRSTRRRPNPSTVEPAASPRPRSTARDDRSEIEAVVASLARALESRDVGRLLAMYPQLSDRERSTWGRFFDRADQLDLTLSVADVLTEGGSARANVEGSYTYVNDEGIQQRDIAFAIEMLRLNGRWQIGHLGSTATGTRSTAGAN